MFELSIEAEKLGREKAIPEGEPCDLIDERYKGIYRAVGREQFIEMVMAGMELKEMKEKLKTK